MFSNKKAAMQKHFYSCMAVLCLFRLKTPLKACFLQSLSEVPFEGNIVISVGLFGHSGDHEVWENMEEGTLTATKEMLDDMHKRKIDMADEIFVINVGGYIGESTRSEIEYAKMTGKAIRYLYP